MQLIENRELHSVVACLGEEVGMESKVVMIAVRNTIAYFGRPCHSRSYRLIQKTGLNPIYSASFQVYEAGPFIQSLIMKRGLAERVDGPYE